MYRSLNEIFIKAFQDYIGMSTNEIVEKLKLPKKYNERNICRTITNKIIEKKLILNNEDACIKTIRINKKLNPRESLSFPPFKYLEIINEEWISSTLYRQINKYFIFVVFQEDDYNTKFNCLRFWKISEKDLETIEKEWLNVKSIIKQGTIIKNVKKGKRFSNFPKESNATIIHLRPHAANAKDCYPLPVADKLTKTKEYTKHSFWLNKSYIKNKILLNEI